jgi:hypothetical protein
MNTRDRELLMEELGETNDFAQRQQLLKLLWHLEQQLQPQDEPDCTLAPFSCEGPVHSPALAR